MQSGPGLIATFQLILAGSARDAETGTSAYTIEIIVPVMDYSSEPKKGQQSPIEGYAFIEAAHSNDNMRYSINLHSFISNCISRFRTEWAGKSPGPPLCREINWRKLENSD